MMGSTGRAFFAFNEKKRPAERNAPQAGPLNLLLTHDFHRAIGLRRDGVCHVAKVKFVVLAAADRADEDAIDAVLLRFGENDLSGASGSQFRSNAQAALIEPV